MDLFSSEPTPPLPQRLRPQKLSDVLGQDHLLKEGVLSLAVRASNLPSCVLWGPSGTGKTTIAQLVAKEAGYVQLSVHAANAGVKELRAACDAAQHWLDHHSKRSVLFVDEVHNLAKAQQDVLLPAMESGLLTLIGATTEHPAYHLNAALLSRAQVFVVKPLGAHDLQVLYVRARQLEPRLSLSPPALNWVCQQASGDARRFLGDLELLLTAQRASGNKDVQLEQAKLWLARGHERVGRQDDDIHALISALQKSVRGSQPQAALFWLALLLQNGADVHLVCRRLTVMASEEVGAADPVALVLAQAAVRACERLGPLEGERALAQLTLHLACAPKSNAVYLAWNQAKAFAQAHPSAKVPRQLRNAPDRLSAGLGYGADYRYAHDEPGGYAAGMVYNPAGIALPKFYQPKECGQEARVRQRMAEWAALDLRAKTTAPPAGNQPAPDSGQLSTKEHDGGHLA